MNKLARNTLALGTATMIVTAALQFSANAADPIVAQSESSAITATGLTSIVDTQKCRAESTGPAVAQGAGICGTGIQTQGAGVITQTASTGLDGDKGTSVANAQVAGVDLPALTTIDLSTVPVDLTSINTGTVINPVLTGLSQTLIDVLNTALALAQTDVQTLLTSVQAAAITPITQALQGAIPISLNIGAVSTGCTLTAGGTAVLTNNVSTINIAVDFPGNAVDLNIPVTLNVSPNSALIGDVTAQQLVTGVVDGVRDTLTTSLNGALGPLALVLGNVQTTLVEPVLAQLGAALLNPLGDALAPIVAGTVNKQETLPSGASQVTALDLNVLGNAITLDLARSQCGPNAVRTVATTPTPTKPTPTQTRTTPSDNDSDNDADSDSDSDGTTPVVDNGDDSDAIADADAQADADVTTTLPSTGAPNLTPFWLLGIALLMFGGAVLVNEKRRLNQI